MIEADQALAVVDHRCRQPRISDGVAAQLFVEPELPQLRPFWAKRGQSHARYRQQGVNEGDGVFDWGSLAKGLSGWG